MSPDPAALADFLSGELAAPITIESIERVTAGARRINALVHARAGSEPLELVITQLPNEGEAFQRSIADEVAWLRLAEAAGARVPSVRGHRAEASGVGGPFFVTDRIDGVSIPKQVVDLCRDTEGLGPRVAHEIGRSLALLHAVPVDALPESVERPEGTAIEAALAWAEEQMAELLQPSPAFSLVVRWLERTAPAPVPAVPIHGDVRNGNILVNEAGLGAMLDWETAHIGEPFEDLAWLAQRMWRARNDQMEIGGFANRSDLRDGYVAGGGTWDEDRFHWWKVFRTLWWGLGLANQARQHLDGSYRNIVMAASGRRVAELEWDALCLIEGR